MQSVVLGDSSCTGRLVRGACCRVPDIVHILDSTSTSHALSSHRLKQIPQLHSRCGIYVFDRCHMLIQLFYCCVPSFWPLYPLDAYERL